MADDSLKSHFEKELAEIKDIELFSREHRRKKFVLYLIRTAIAVTLYIIFWKYSWVRWSLVLFIPLNLFALISIIGWSYFLNRKIRKVRKTIDEAEKVANDW